MYAFCMFQMQFKSNAGKAEYYKQRKREKERERKLKHYRNNNDKINSSKRENRLGIPIPATRARSEWMRWKTPQTS